MHVQVEHFPRALAGRTEAAVELGEGATVSELVRALGLHPDAILVVRGRDPIPLDAPLAAGERLRVVHTVSGGV